MEVPKNFNGCCCRRVTPKIRKQGYYFIYFCQSITIQRFFYGQMITRGNNYLTFLFKRNSFYLVFCMEEFRKCLSKNIKENNITLQDKKYLS